MNSSPPSVASGRRWPSTSPGRSLSLTDIWDALSELLQDSFDWIFRDPYADEGAVSTLLQGVGVSTEFSTGSQPNGQTSCHFE